MRCFRGTLLAVALSLVGCDDGGPSPVADPPVPTPARTSAAVPSTATVPDPLAAAADASARADVDDKAQPASSAAAATTVSGAQPSAQAARPIGQGVAEGAPDGGGADEPEVVEQPEPKTVVGNKNEQPQYAAWLQSVGNYLVGKPSSVQAVLVAKDGWKCNDAYPYKFKVKGSPPGVTFAANIVRGASIGKSRTTLRVPFTPSSSGAKTINGTFYFSVCNESNCKIQKQPLSVTVDVKDADAELDGVSR